MDIELPTRAIPTASSQTAQQPGKLKLVAGDNAVKVESTTTAAKANSKEAEQNVAQQLENSVSKLNELVQSVQRDLQFSIDESSGDTVIKVLDTNTEEVIRQIPSEEVLALTRNIESLKGVLFSAEV